MMGEKLPTALGGGGWQEFHSGHFSFLMVHGHFRRAHLESSLN